MVGCSRCHSSGHDDTAPHSDSFLRYPFPWARPPDSQRPKEKLRLFLSDFGMVHKTFFTHFDLHTGNSRQGSQEQHLYDEYAAPCHITRKYGILHRQEFKIQLRLAHGWRGACVSTVTLILKRGGGSLVNSRAAFKGLERLTTRHSVLLCSKAAELIFQRETGSEPWLRHGEGSSGQAMP